MSFESGSPSCALGGTLRSATTVGSIISFLIGAAMLGAISFVPLFVQGTMGGTATDAGKMLTPFLLGWVSLAVVGGRLMLKAGYRPTVLAGLVVLTASFILLSRFDATTPRWKLLTDGVDRAL